MAQYYPPTEDVPIFDTNLFEDPNEFLTVTKANGKYLRFPNAQGTENLQAITVSGTSIFNNTMSANATVFFNSGSVYTNPTGGYNLNIDSTATDVDLYGLAGIPMNFRINSRIYPDWFFALYNGTTNALEMLIDSTDPLTTLLLTDATCKTVLGGKWRVRGNTASTFGLLDLVTPTLDGMTMYMANNSGNPTITTKNGTFDFLDKVVTAPTLTSPIVRICANKSTGAIAGDAMGIINFAGRDGVNTSPASAGGLGVFSTNTWSNINHSTYMLFNTTATNTLVPRSVMALTEAGFLRIGASTAVASYPLHITTVNGVNSTLLIDAGSSTANSPVLSLHNNEATSATTRQVVDLCMAKNAGNFALNSLPGDGILRVNNTTGTTTNRLLLSANSAINAPFIDVGNRMHMGTDTTGTSLLNIKGTFPQFKITSGDFANPASINMISPSGFTSSMTLNDTALFINSSTGFVYCSGSHLAPSPSNTYDCGRATLYWKNVFSAAYPAVSDGRLKKDIKPSNLGLGFINKLNPVSFKFISSPDVLEGNVIVDNGGVREHYGLITQDVKKVLDEEGINGAMWSLADVKDPESRQFLCYNELISPMIKAIQELTLLVKDLRTEINELKAK